MTRWLFNIASAISLARMRNSNADQNSRMRRTLRKLLDILTALSLLPFVATVVMWARSYFFLDSFKHRNQDTSRFVSVASLGGGLQFASCSGVIDDGWGIGVESMALRGRPWPENWQLLTGYGTRHDGRFLGLRLAYGDLGTLVPRPMPFWSVRLPYWLIFVLSALPAFLGSRQVFNRLVRNRRIGRSLCVHCAYELTGNISGRCPECGTLVAQKIKVTA
jgi:hypothetical protein